MPLVPAVLAVLMQTSPAPSASPGATPSPLESASASPSPVPLRRDGPVQIPATWLRKSVPSMMGAVEIGAWTDGTDGGESLDVRRMPSVASVSKNMAAMYRQLLKGSAVTYVSGNAVTLCGGLRGWEDRYHDASGGGLTVVIATTPMHAYSSTYSYPGYPGASPAGNAAAESLCPPRDTIAHAGAPPVFVPSGWTAIGPVTYPEVPPLGRTIWAWTRGQRRSQQVFQLWKFAVPSGFNGFAMVMDQLEAGTTRTSRVHREPIGLCHTYDGGYIEIRTLNDNVPTEIESIVTVAGHQEYLASYSRPASSPADVSAERALRSLCPRS